MNVMRFGAAFAALGMFCACSPAAFAQSAADGSDAIIDVTQSGGDSAEAGSVVIGEEELERLGPQDLQDVFKTTPGVQVGSSLAISQKVYVQGIEETNLAVTIDGARQNNKIFHHAGTNYIDPDLLKAVRVDPGVAPADAGPGALAGALTYETKDVGDLLAPGDNFGGILGAEYVSNGDVFSSNVTLFGRHEGIEALGFFKIARGGEFEDGAGEEVLGSGTDIVSGLAKIAYHLGNGYRIEGSYESVSDEESRPLRANFIHGSMRTTPYELRRQTYVASFENTAPHGLFNLKGRLAHSGTELDASIFEPSSGYTHSLSGMLANEAHFGLGTLNLGVDFYKDETVGSFASNPGDVTEKADNIGVFGQARIEPFEQFRLSFGARGDWHTFTGTDGSESENSGLSGNISGEYDVLPFLTAGAGASHVFGGVALAEPYIASLTWAYPAGGMQPATADNVFAKLEFKGGGVSDALDGFTLGGKVFRTNLNDVRDESFGGGPDIYREVDSEGFEVWAGYEAPEGLIKLAYADIESEIDGVAADSDVGQYLTTPIGRVLTAEAAYNFAPLGVTLGADAQFVFEQQGTYLGAPTGKDWPAYEVVNAFISYQPTSLEGVTLRAEVNNIFDELYADRGTYAQEFAGTQVLNEPGRSFTLSSKVAF